MIAHKHVFMFNTYDKLCMFRSTVDNINTVCSCVHFAANLENCRISLLF